MKNKLNITISIDDINPLKGWGAEGDIQMSYLEDLHREFGAKFTLFIPSNYHKQAPLSKHKDWVNWLKSKKYFELAAHGHYHECENEGIGECEFWELNTEQKAKDRINLMLKEWEAVGHKPEGLSYFRYFSTICPNIMNIIIIINGYVKHFMVQMVLI